MSAPVRKRSYQEQAMIVAFGPTTVIQTPELEVESCATNSRTMSGLP